jgi:hypothetical protein
MGDQRSAGGGSPALTVADKARILRVEMDAIAVDKIEHRGISHRLAAAGAQVSRHGFSMQQMPAVLQLSTGEEFGFGSGAAAVVFTDGGALFEEVAPINFY